MKESLAAADAARAQITEKKKALEEAARSRTETLLQVIASVFPFKLQDVSCSAGF